MARAKEPKQADRKEEFLDRALPCRLTQDEFTFLGSRLGRELDELYTAKSEAKETMTRLKAAIATREREVARLGRVLREGHEERLVRCHKIIDYAANQVTIARTDTGEVLESRGISALESQRDLIPADFGSSLEDGEE